MSKKQLINHIAEKLHGYGYTVYLSASGEYGFYTDGDRVVSFGGHWSTMVDFSGNYAPSRESGTGWGIAKEQTDITREQADAYVKADAPSWTRNKNPIYTTPEQHLKTYGQSSGYVKFEPAQPLEWKALWDAMDASPDAWIPTTEAMYWQMLECVPPRAQTRAAFLVGEPLRHDANGDAVHACFKETPRGFFARNLTVKQFKEQTA